MTGKILIVDDDKRINELLNDIFERENFETLSAFNGEEAIQILTDDADIDLVVLDLMMPEVDGWEVLRYISSYFDVRVLVLTALDGDVTEVQVLRQGADDYMAKPFSQAVLIERAKRLVQRRKGDKHNLCCGDLRLNEFNRKVYIRGEEMTMTPKEYQILYYLMTNCNVVVSREQILMNVWGMDYDGDDRVVDSQIRMLRKSLRDHGNSIRTVRGIGYCYDGDVKKR